MMNRTLPAALAVLALAVTLSACAPEPQPAPTTASPTATPSAVPSPSPSPIETEKVNEPAAAPTCDTLIAPSTIEIFDGHGWTYKQNEFRIGADVIDGGIQCVWGDYTVASDHVQVFGWAPLAAAESTPAQQKLLAEGWKRADEDGHTYITEDPQYSISLDETGFGMTYEFGDGWVILADTKQSLILIQRP
ncbi:hypothetical protein [Microbacterium sp.]|uniref:hypothetical protein n=1 Tax=Microbacterium sp. TaxID=51671 RepID=UPI003F9A482A